MTAKIYLALALHNHQPVGNFDNVFEEAYQKAYLPMLEALERHPTVRLAVHNTGCLLDWMFEAHPEYIARMSALVERGQIEILSGGYYEPILVALPDADKHGQIRKLTDTVSEQFGYEASGAWLAERVWEPHLPKSLNEAGIDFTIVDDTHFRYAGLNDEDMLGYYVTEEQGKSLKIFGTAKQLRYTVPWVPVAEVIAWLREQSERDLPLYSGKQRVAVMGDDGEKFGLWPGTFEHCWGEEGWIEEFFTALEANSDWLITTTLADYAREQPALGQIYMPAASYDEMTEWALPTQNSAEIIELKHDLQTQNADHILKFLKGGLWRGFLSKYPEVNQMQKKTLWVSEQVHKMRSGKKRKLALQKLWAAQCNCAYWHGLFGGIYLFHIRGANYRNLIEAEQLAGNTKLSVTSIDFTRNGSQDVVLSNREQWLQIDAANGGAIVEWDFRAAPYNLLNNVSRRREAYHQDIVDAAANGTQRLSGDSAELENVHGTTVKVKEFGLEDKLIYDWYRRAALQDRFFDTDVTFETYAQVAGEIGDFVNQPYAVEMNKSKRQIEIVLTRHGGVWQGDLFAPIVVEKRLVLARKSAELTVHYKITNAGDQPFAARFGVENNWGLEGGQDGLTYFVGLEDAAGERRYPGQSGQADAIDQFSLVSDIVTVRSRVDQAMSNSAEIWWFPIETVTNSESGYEPNYQGTAMLTSWQLALAPQASWESTLAFKLSTTDG